MGKIATSVLLKPIINGNERDATQPTPLMDERNTKYFQTTESN